MNGISKMMIQAAVLVSMMMMTSVNALAGLSVRGNQLVDDNGNVVQLRGVDRSGTEYACVGGWGIFDGPTDGPALQAIQSWGVNAVRVPLNEDCWLGINGINPQYGGQAYQSAIIDWVFAINSYNMYAIVDLHWAAPGGQVANTQLPMPNSDNSPNFWASVANAFLANRTVIFDLYNEPFPENGVWDSDTAWQCLRDGNCPSLGYSAAGMQSLVDAVRSTGSRNVLMVSGLAWSNSFVQWLSYVPNDPQGQIAASWHSYNFNQCNNQGCWDQYIAPVAAQYPVITGEMGENDCASGYIDTLMPYADSKGISYLGWAWNTADCGAFPALITDYSGTPTGFGQGLHDHLTSLAAKNNHSSSISA